jgi:hypothetical protein
MARRYLRANSASYSAHSDPLPLLKGQATRLTETLKLSDKDTRSMLVPLLARLLESPTGHR